MVLYGNSICPFCQRAKLAMLACYKEVTYHEVDFINKPSWIMEVSPIGKIPILETSDGFLFDSNVIVSYIDSKNNFSLSSNDNYTRHQLLSWVKLIDHTHELAREYFLTNDNNLYDNLSIKISSLAEEIFEGNFLKKSLQDSRPPIMDIYMMPLYFLLNILSKYSKRKIIKDNSNYQIEFTKNPHQEYFFGEEIKINLLKFLCNRHSLFAKNSAKFIQQ